MRRRKIQGWGYEDEGLTPEETSELEEKWAGFFNVESFDVTPPPTLDEIELREPRIKAPAALSSICSTDRYDRAFHSYGASLMDSIRAFQRDFSNPPDIVAYPRTEDDISALMDWCGDKGIALVPFGGGTSVVNGVEPPKEGFGATISLDMKNFNKIVEVDETSLAARIQGGIQGLDLEAQLKPHGLTMRHYMQSYALSTFGGWIATRSSGHFATVYTHIDDMIESIRTVTPEGVMESRRLPGSGAGPSPDRMVLGSEGSIGIITEAWTRVHRRPTHRASASVLFDDFATASRAVRAISQAGLHPANCRVVDGTETKIAGAGDGSQSMLALSFESADHPVEHWLDLALLCCQDHGGTPIVETDEDARRSGAAGKYRNYFIRLPFQREFMTARAILNETFETAITWDRVEDFHAKVSAETEAAIRDVTGGPAYVTCRYTHIYPDGPAPYFTWRALGRKEALLEQYAEIKARTADIVERLGGTVTHHHAVGRLHRPWYDKQRPNLFGEAYRAAKKRLDPAGIMNPGIIVDSA